MRRLAWVFVLLGLCTVTIFAQRRAVRGRVTDSSGAPVPGVTVELTKDGLTLRTTTTGADGQFSLDIVDLAEGTFDVRLTVPGFAVQAVRLSAGTPRSTVQFAGFTAEVRASSLATAAPAPPPPPPPPPPAPPQGGRTTQPSEVPADANNHAIVPVFFATDRSRVTYAPLAYGPDREPSQQLHLGRIDVSIPRDHQPGQVERPTIWTFWREDPTKHFIVVKAREQGYDEFYQDVASVVAKSSRKEAFVFVHGFNVAFDAAVYRTAQMAYDLGFDGAPILYSWPSLGTPTGYPVDANNSEWTIDHLHWFLEDVAARSGAEFIHVIAHSRGNWPLMNALNAIATEPHAGRRARFAQIILTAPDVDADTFKVLARRFSMVGERTTLYASANDEALALSKRYQGYQRAGDVRPHIVTTTGVDSIDVSTLQTGFLGHSYYGDNTSVISDIARLLRTGWPPDRRCGIQPTVDALLHYWTFIARAVCPAGSA